MPRSLDVEKLSESLASLGLSQSDLAKQVGVSRNAVSKWMKGEALPRPDKLLKVALAAGLSYDDIIRTTNEREPVVAFRKRGARKTRSEHVQRAKDMGRLLERLVPFVPFDDLRQHPTLKSPVPEYNYLQRVARDVRKQVGVAQNEPVEFHSLVQRFDEFSVVLVPVMWGRREAHENALHIRLPESDTTWIYLNLDTHSHDFKFWISHELGHVISPTLSDDEAEDFADRFACALLFPRECAEEAYGELRRFSNPRSILGRLTGLAEQFGISPITVLEGVEEYVRASGSEPLSFERKLVYPAATNFNKQHYTVREALFNGDDPAAASYIERSESVFSTPFFDALRKYLRESQADASFVHAVLNCPLVDARAIASELG